jgi:molecular chaperone GrpE (heat shock protein)
LDPPDTELSALTKAEKAEEYKEEVSRRIQQNAEDKQSQTANERYEMIKETLKKTAEELLPRAPKKSQWQDQIPRRCPDQPTK